MKIRLEVIRSLDIYVWILFFVTLVIPIYLGPAQMASRLPFSEPRKNFPTNGTTATGTELNNRVNKLSYVCASLSPPSLS